MKRYLSKSRYKIAFECPTKLFYTGKKEFVNKKLDDRFLRELAKGGFQVGALAQAYHPDGILIDSRDSATALAETQKQMAKENVTLFEPAFAFENFLVRVDVLIKQGKHIKLIEVKSSSYSPEDVFHNKTAIKKGVFKLTADWEPYLQDVAFQYFVLSNALKGHTVIPYLGLLDKSALTSVEGLNQKFFLQPDGNSHKVVPNGDISLEKLGNRILVDVNVEKEVSHILQSPVEDSGTATIPSGLPYADYIRQLAAYYEKDQLLEPTIGSKCKKCEYRVAPEQQPANTRSGFEECWTAATKKSPKELAAPLVIDIWAYTKSDELLADSGPLMSAVDLNGFQTKPHKDKTGLSSSERQKLQIAKATEDDATPFADLDLLGDEISRWKFPYHFIDFETSMVAIPFSKDKSPYEQIAFQFSHHVMHEDGRIEHRGQYIDATPGKFPNFDFVRALKKELEGDNGTIFRFASHENTVLCQIYTQIQNAKPALPDADALCAWIRTITKSTGSMEEEWEGERAMVDMLDMVKRFYYHPATNGSNSIKKVLPAVLNEAKFLQEKYSQPIYGTPGQISSLNFENHIWIEYETNGSVKDPYKQLPAIFEGVENEILDTLMGTDELADGGAAMMAYAKMQFTQMSDQERKAVTAALLRYCELDTLAMVLICEYWQHMVGAARGTQAA